MVNGRGLEVSPEAALNTVTWATPAAAMSEAGMAAVNCVALMNPVGRALPFHRTCEDPSKFVPVRVRVNAGPPAVALLGTMEVSVGAWAKRCEPPVKTNSKHPDSRIRTRFLVEQRLSLIAVSSTAESDLYRQHQNFKP
jgi:hypothetical protein